MSLPLAQTISIRGIDCRLHVWKPKKEDSQKGAIAVVYHGFLAHSRYPTVRYAAELLYHEGYTVYAADLPGHGESAGLRGYLSSAAQTIQDGVTIAQHVLKQEQEGVEGEKIPKLFLIGSSLGGCIALNVALQMNKSQQQQQQQGRGGGGEADDCVSGVVLLAPMLAIKVSSSAQMLLKALSYLIPTLAVIPSSASDSAKQYRDPEKLRECEEDELTVSLGALRVASASACVELAGQIQDKFQGVDFPFLCMVAKEDVVVDSQGSIQLFDQATSQDKTLKMYDALHGLLCETEPLISEIHKDLLDWMDERA